jgi:hypothetical protein
MPAPGVKARVDRFWRAVRRLKTISEVGEENLDREFVEYIGNLRMSPSAFMVFLGVDMDLSSARTH